MWWAYTPGGAYIRGGGLIVGGLRYSCIFRNTRNFHLQNPTTTLFNIYTTVNTDYPIERLVYLSHALTLIFLISIGCLMT